MTVVALAACVDRTTTAPTASAARVGARAPQEVEVSAEPRFSPELAAINARLEAMAAPYRIATAEYVTDASSGQAGILLFAHDRFFRTGLDWVPGDPRRGGRTNITYLVDESDGIANTSFPLPAPPTAPLLASATAAAIDRAMDTWEQEPCGAVDIVKVADDPAIDPDVVDFFLGPPAVPPGTFGQLGTPGRADIIHAGWLPTGFFNALAPPNGGNFILGVTITGVFLEPGTSGPTDIDGNGQGDVWFREIYYNNRFRWGINTTAGPIDVETVALHETGHGLSQGHFGLIFGTLANLRLHFAPFAVMNAAISRQAHALEPTDHAGHCQLWESWPNR